MNLLRNGQEGLYCWSPEDAGNLKPFRWQQVRIRTDGSEIEPKDAETTLYADSYATACMVMAEYNADTMKAIKEKRPLMNYYFYAVIP
jgi:hypothetical protein